MYPGRLCKSAEETLLHSKDLMIYYTVKSQYFDNTDFDGDTPIKS